MSSTVEFVLGSNETSGSRGRKSEEQEGIFCHVETSTTTIASDTDDEGEYETSSEGLARRADRVEEFENAQNIGEESRKVESLMDCPGKAGGIVKGSRRSEDAGEVDAEDRKRLATVVSWETDIQEENVYNGEKRRIVVAEEQRATCHPERRKTFGKKLKEEVVGSRVGLNERFIGQIKKTSSKDSGGQGVSSETKEFLDDSRSLGNSSINARTRAIDKSTCFLSFHERSSLATITEIFPPIKSESSPAFESSSRCGRAWETVARDLRNCASSHAREKKLRMIVMGHLTASEEDQSIGLRDFTVDEKKESNSMLGVPALQIDKDGTREKGTRFRELKDKFAKVTTDSRERKVKDASVEDLIDIAENSHPSYKSFYFSPSPRESIDRAINEIAPRLEEPTPSISNVDSPARAIGKVSCRLQGQHRSLGESGNRSPARPELLEESESHEGFVQVSDTKSQCQYGSIGESDGRSQGYRRSRTCFKDLDILLRIGGELAPLQQRLSEITGKFRALELTGLSRNFLHVRDYTNVQDFHTSQRYPGLPCGHSSLDMSPRHFFQPSFYDSNVTPRLHCDSRPNPITGFLHVQNCPGSRDSNAKFDLHQENFDIKSLKSAGNPNSSSNLSQRRECIGNPVVDATYGTSCWEKCIVNSEPNVPQAHKCIGNVDERVASIVSCDHRHIPGSDPNVKSDPWEQEGNSTLFTKSFTSRQECLAINLSSCLSLEQKPPDAERKTPDLINQGIYDTCSAAPVVHKQPPTISTEGIYSEGPLTNQNASINLDTKSPASPVIRDTFRRDPCNSQSIGKKGGRDPRRNGSSSPGLEFDRRALCNEVRLIYASSNVISGEEPASTSLDESTSVNERLGKVESGVGNDPTGTLRQDVARCHETSASLISQPGNSAQGYVQVGREDFSDNTVASNETLKDSACSLASSWSVETARNLSLADLHEVPECQVRGNVAEESTCTKVSSCQAVGQDTCKELSLHGLCFRVESNINARGKTAAQGTMEMKEKSTGEDFSMATVENTVQDKTTLMLPQSGSCGTCDNRQKVEKLPASSKICIAKRVVNPGLRKLNSTGSPGLPETSGSSDPGKDFGRKKDSATSCGEPVLTSSQTESLFVAGQRLPICSDEKAQAAFHRYGIQNKIHSEAFGWTNFPAGKTRGKPGQEPIPQHDKPRDDPVLTRPQMEPTGIYSDTRNTMEGRFPQGHSYQQTNQIGECTIADLPPGAQRNGLHVNSPGVSEEKTSMETLGSQGCSGFRDGRAWCLDPLSMGLQIHPPETPIQVDNKEEASRSHVAREEINLYTIDSQVPRLERNIIITPRQNFNGSDTRENFHGTYTFGGFADQQKPNGKSFGEFRGANRKSLFVEETGGRRLENRVDKSVAIEVLLPRSFSKGSCTSSTCLGIARQVRRVDANTQVLGKTYSSRGVSPFQSLHALENSEKESFFYRRDPSANFPGNEDNAGESGKMLHFAQTSSLGGEEKFREFGESVSLTADESSRRKDSPAGQTARNANPEEFPGSPRVSGSREFPGKTLESQELEKIVSVAGGESLKRTDDKTMNNFPGKVEEKSQERRSAETTNSEESERINSSDPGRIKVGVIRPEKSADAAINSPKLGETSCLMKKNVLGQSEKYSNKTSRKSVYEDGALNLKARGKLIESNKKHRRNRQENGKDNAREQKAMSPINSWEYEKINSPNSREFGEVAVGSAERTNMTISREEYGVAVTESNSLGSCAVGSNERREEKAQRTKTYPAGREKSRATEIIRTRVLQEVTGSLRRSEGNNPSCEGLRENTGLSGKDIIVENNPAGSLRNISINAHAGYPDSGNFQEDLASQVNQKDLLTSLPVIGSIPTDGRDVEDVKRGDNRRAEVSRTEDPIDAEETDRSNYSLVRNLVGACPADLDAGEERTTDNQPPGFNEPTINRDAFTKTNYGNDLSVDGCGELEKVEGRSICEAGTFDSDANYMRICTGRIMEKQVEGCETVNEKSLEDRVNETLIMNNDPEESVGQSGGKMKIASETDKNLLQRESISRGTASIPDDREMKTSTKVISLTTEEGNAGEVEQMEGEKEGSPGNSANGISRRDVKSRLSLQSTAALAGEKKMEKKVKKREEEGTNEEDEVKENRGEKRDENEEKKENEETFKRSSCADKKETELQEKRGADEEEKSATKQQRGSTIPRDSWESLLCPSGSDEFDETRAANPSDRITIVPVVFANGALLADPGFSKFPQDFMRPAAILQEIPLSSGTGGSPLSAHWVQVSSLERAQLPGSFVESCDSSKRSTRGNGTSRRIAVVRRKSHRDQTIAGGFNGNESYARLEELSARGHRIVVLRRKGMRSQDSWSSLENTGSFVTARQRTDKTKARAKESFLERAEESLTCFTNFSETSFSSSSSSLTSSWTVRMIDGDNRREKVPERRDEVKRRNRVSAQPRITGESRGQDEARRRTRREVKGPTQNAAAQRKIYAEENSARRGRENRSFVSQDEVSSRPGTSRKRSDAHAGQRGIPTRTIRGVRTSPEDFLGDT